MAEGCPKFEPSRLRHAPPSLHHSRQSFDQWSGSALHLQQSLALVNLSLDRCTGQPTWKNVLPTKNPCGVLWHSPALKRITVIIPIVLSMENAPNLSSTNTEWQALLVTNDDGQGPVQGIYSGHKALSFKAWSGHGRVGIKNDP